MLICELKAKGNFYRPVAQEVSPWFAYSNDDGYLVKEAPPPPPMAPTASPPGPVLNPLDDVPLSIRSGAKSRPSPEGVAPSSAMDFPSQFSDADFEGTVTIRTWEHGTHQRQGRLKGNASVTSFSATSFGARWETTYADGEERTSALPPTASGPSSPVKHKCLHKAYNGRWLTSYHRTINT